MILHSELVYLISIIYSFNIGNSDSAMYFTVPRNAYLIDAQDIGMSAGLCILGIVGFVPSNENKFIFGSVFL